MSAPASADPPTLRSRRIALGWTQRELARVTGLPQNLMTYAERRPAEHPLHQTIDDALLLEEARRRECAREEAVQAALQALIAAIPAGPEWTALQAAIKERAVDYLEANKTDACDALLELLPDAESRALLDDFFGDPLQG